MHKVLTLQPESNLVGWLVIVVLKNDILVTKMGFVLLLGGH